MNDLAVYTRVGPTERIGKYEHFISRILTTHEVNIFIEILMIK